ncbi:MAG: TldD/PmbA family protein [Thermoleophilia bacterium]
MQIDELTADLLDATIHRALRHGGDFAEVFVEDRRSLGLSLEDRRVECAAGGREAGFGVRLTSGDRTYYSYSDDLSEADLQRAADTVSAALRAGADGAQVTNLGALHEAWVTADITVPPASVATSVKAALLRAADEAARSVGPAVSQVIAGYLESRQRLLVANSYGALVADDRTRLRFTVSVVARRDGVIQTGYDSLGKSLGFEILDEGVVQALARSAAGKAVTMLDARPAPTGPMAVVMGNGFGGTLFHEACGHGLEADGIAKGSSIYEGKVGDVVASAIVNAYDDGTIAGEWGSAAVDDEGAPTQKTVVIEEGRLRGFLYDGLRAREEGVGQTGNGRRQSFRHVPIPRMTTTCIAPGDATADEVVAATDRGFYAKSLAGGQVEPASGNFVFGVAEGYLIEHGRITAPLRGATLVGNGIDVLKSIDMIASDFEVRSGICGKDGQSVPVGTGQATLRIAAMTVGGTG